MTSYHWDIQAYHCPSILWSENAQEAEMAQWAMGLLNKPEENYVLSLISSTHTDALWWRRWDPWGKLARLHWAEFRWEICPSLTSKCTYTLPHPQPTNINTHRMLKEQSKKYLLLWLKKTHFSQYWGKVEEKQRKDLCEALKEMGKI